MICLDTNVAIAVLRQSPGPVMQRFLAALPTGELALPAVVLFELHFGVANSTRRQENADRLLVFLQAPIAILPFDAEDAALAGSLRAMLRQAGTLIGPYDLLIAAQALRLDALLVTANLSEFGRIPGLRVEDWSN